MSLSPSDDLFPHILTAVRTLSAGHPELHARVASFRPYTSMSWAVLPKRTKVGICTEFLDYVLLLKEAGPLARERYAPHLWHRVGYTALKFCNTELYGGHKSFGDVERLLVSWDPESHGKKCTEEDVTDIRTVLGMVHAMKEAHRELPSIDTLIAHPGITARKAHYYREQEAGFEY
ncbi:hypothetical protein JCM6882_004574 [Rhodosporidiobolus microsporus]